MEHKTLIQNKIVDDILELQIFNSKYGVDILTKDKIREILESNNFSLILGDDNEIKASLYVIPLDDSLDFNDKNQVFYFGGLSAFNKKDLFSLIKKTVNYIEKLNLNAIFFTSHTNSKFIKKFGFKEFSFLAKNTYIHTYIHTYIALAKEKGYKLNDNEKIYVRFRK